MPGDLQHLAQILGEFFQRGCLESGNVNKMISKTRILLIVFIFFGVAAIAACANEVQERKELLEKTPIGASFDEVLAFCALRKLKCKQSKTAGYFHHKSGKTVGVQSIWAGISEQKETPLTVTTFSAYWGFDKDGKLLDIWVWKTVDAP
jgi:hypothetical protein